MEIIQQRVLATKYVDVTKPIQRLENKITRSIEGYFYRNVYTKTSKYSHYCFRQEHTIEQKKSILDIVCYSLYTIQETNALCFDKQTSLHGKETL